MTASAIIVSLLIGLSVAIWQAVVATQERDRAVLAELDALDEAERADAILAFLNEAVFFTSNTLQTG